MSPLTFDRYLRTECLIMALRTYYGTPFLKPKGDIDR